MDHNNKNRTTANIPVYKQLSPVGFCLGKTGKCHPGLYFEKGFAYPNCWYKEIEELNLSKQKTEFLEKFHGKKVGQQTQLTNACNRMKALVKNLPRRHAKTLATDWHFVTGMGNAHPLENGLIWHPTLGVPFLPASSLKGLVRAWFERDYWQSLEDAPETAEALAAQIKRWFGTTPQEKSQEKPYRAIKPEQPQAGLLMFFDALPSKPVELVMDTITPHTGDWKENGATGEAVPADWHSPIPIPFLAAKHICMQFIVAARPGSDITEDEFSQVSQGMSNALAHLGAGAKTAVGYGIFSEDDSHD